MRVEEAPAVTEAPTRNISPREVYGNWRVWVVGLSLFCANIMRYGFLGWAVTYFFEVQGAAISTAAYKSVIFPIAGAVGAIVAGWLSDKIKSGKVIVAAACMGLAALSAAMFPTAEHWPLGLGLLASIGFFLFGAHPILCAAAPMDFGTKKAASSATGFIDCLGYIGAGLTSVGTGFLVDTWGWNAGFAFWIGAALVGAGLMGVLSVKRRSVSA
jgi:sugar phosphate permease